MQARKFHLQPVLSYKQSLEEIYQLELAQLKQALAKEEEHLRQLENLEREVSQELRSFQAESQLNLELIKLTIDFLQSLRTAISGQSETVRRLSASVDDKRDQLVKTMQERKVLEKLKDKFLAELEEESRRQEARLADEIGTTLYTRTALVEGQPGENNEATN